MSNLRTRPDGGSRGGCPRLAGGTLWTVEHRSAPAAALLAADPSGAGARSARVVTAVRPALVLGSTQPAGDADVAACTAAGVDVVRRRSGGGAVLVEPARTLWVEVVIPTGDELWCDDVGRAFVWVGRAWAAALDVVGVAGATVHEGAAVGSGWERTICFAGVGPGEVVVGGRKIVGISQRRTRSYARFQCAVHLGSDPTAVADLLALGPADRAAARRAVADRSAPLRGVAAAALEAAFLSALPGATAGDG